MSVDAHRRNHLASKSSTRRKCQQTPTTCSTPLFAHPEGRAESSAESTAIDTPAMTMMEQATTAVTHSLPTIDQLALVRGAAEMQGGLVRDPGVESGTAGKIGRRGRLKSSQPHGPTAIVRQDEEEDDDEAERFRLSRPMVTKPFL